MNALLMALASLTAFAADLPRSEFTFTQGKESFVTVEKQKLTVSAACLKKNGALECDATKNLKSLSWKKRKKGDHNPGSTLCENQLEGTVVVGLSEKGDENSFCRFPDGSMIDSGSLIYRARKND